MKKLLALGLAAVVAAGSLAPLSADAASLGKNKIGVVGNQKQTVYKGEDFELEVRTGANVKDRNLYWTTSNKNIVKVIDDDRSDDEIELLAVGKGTAKVTCKNNLTGGKLVYTITVKNPSKTISRVGEAKRSVTVGNELELRVKKNGNLPDSYLYWTTSNKNVVKIADDDRSDDEIELRAVKAGTAKITCKNEYTGGKIVYTVTVKSGNKKIARVGNAKRTVEVGDDIELSVKKNGLKNSQIKWTISDSSILRFEDGDNYGAEVEVAGRRTGTAKVVANNLQTGGKITYTITVVPDYDDDYDDDWDDDEWDD